MNLHLIYVKYSKTLAYLVSVANKLTGTVDQDNPQRFFRHVRVTRAGDRYKMVVFALSRCGTGKHIRGPLFAGSGGFKVVALSEVHRRADWRLLGNPICCEALVDDNCS